MKANETENSTPFFSVVIPTYKRPELLVESVSSVLDQTFTDFELLVVDDDPQESARKVVEQFVEPRVTYLANDRRRGGAGTRNAGIQRARGKWIAFHDDDDFWLPEKLARQHQKLVDAPDDLGLLYTGHANYDFGAQRTVSVRRPQKRGWISDDLLVRNWVGGLFSVAIRADLLHRVGGLDEEFPALQDLELYVRIARLAQVDYIDETLVLVRKDNGDRITRNPGKKLLGSQLFWNKYRDRIDRSWKLRHHAAARVFTYAVAAGDIATALGAAPWTIAGLVVEPENLREIAWRLLQQQRYQRAQAAEAVTGGGRGLASESRTT